MRHAHRQRPNAHRQFAKDKNEWARRVSELRTADGWTIVTRSSGRDDLAVGIYVLEEDRQTYEHDLAIPDPVLVAVLRYDSFKFVECGWNRSMLSPDDPRNMLELHHMRHRRDRERTRPTTSSRCATSTMTQPTTIGLHDRLFHNFLTVVCAVSS